MILALLTYTDYPFFCTHIYTYIWYTGFIYLLYQTNNTMTTIRMKSPFQNQVIEKVSNSSIVLMFVWCSLWRESSELVCCMRYTYDPCTTYLHRLPFFLYIIYIYIYIWYTGFTCFALPNQKYHGNLNIRMKSSLSKILIERWVILR